MPKKTDSTPKPVAPAAAAPETSTPAPAPAVKRAVKPAAKTKTGVPKPKAPSVKAKRTTKTAVAVAPAIPGTADTLAAFSREDIALRAYFISEKRRSQGLAGDEHQDWIEAERQLVTESARPKKTQKARKA